MKARIACVTGANGLIGAFVVEQLLKEGYVVRALVRNFTHIKGASASLVEIFVGDLSDKNSLSRFLDGAEDVYHCAGEIRNEPLMWVTNVLGTQNLIEVAIEKDIKYFCYISSAGVVGTTQDNIVVEDAICRPNNAYEKSKYAAENLVRDGVGGAKVVILRPTNVVAPEINKGHLEFIFSKTISSRFKFLIKGREHSHIVHAKDVARASIYLRLHGKFRDPQIYFVSMDHDSNNYFWRLAKCANKSSFLHECALPRSFIIKLRWMLKRGANSKEVIYSSQKLSLTGFEYDYSCKIMMELAKGD